MVNLSIRADVAVVGAGPAGSSLASFLRLQGASVVVLEREHFPRFHVGESLLTMCVPALRRMGVSLEGADFANMKPGALFMLEPTRERLRIDFSRGLEGTFPYAFQVERAHFDAALAHHAEALGADVHYGAQVRSWVEDADGVCLSGEWGSVRAQLAVDATGQDAFFGRRQRTVEQLERFGRAASFTTFAPVRSATARECVGNGDILILLVPDGWMWLIPLSRERVSVGLVERTPRPGVSAEQAVSHAIEQSEFLVDFFANSNRVQPFRRIANYSYYNRTPSTARSATVGDASVFLDPIFSSGVTVAVTTAEMLATTLVASLHSGSPLEMKEYRAACLKAYTTFDRLIERFYRPEWVQNVFFSAGKDDRMLREFTAILAGDVWRDDNEVQRLLLASAARTGPEIT